MYSFTSSVSTFDGKVKKQQFQYRSSDGTRAQHSSVLTKGKPQRSHTSVKRGPYTLKIDLTQSPTKLTDQEIKEYMSKFVHQDVAVGTHHLLIGPFRTEVRRDVSTMTATELHNDRRQMANMVRSLIGTSVAGKPLDSSQKKKKAIASQ